MTSADHVAVTAAANPTATGTGVFCETRLLDEEWTYRYLAAAHAWTSGEQAATARLGAPDLGAPDLGAQFRQVPTGSSSADVWEWTRAQGLELTERGSIPAAIRRAWVLALAGPARDGPPGASG